MLVVLSDIPLVNIPSILPEILAGYNMKHVQVWRVPSGQSKENVYRYA